MMERSPSYCYFEDITNCSHVGVLPVVQVDLTMNGESLRKTKETSKLYPSSFPGIKILSPKEIVTLRILLFHEVSELKLLIPFNTIFLGESLGRQ